MVIVRHPDRHLPWMYHLATQKVIPLHLLLLYLVVTKPHLPQTMMVTLRVF